jgi:hypothetical protein
MTPEHNGTKLRTIVLQSIIDMWKKLLQEADRLQIILLHLTGWP